MRAIIPWFVVVSLAGFGAHAEIGTIDQAPAATLLAPYFEIGPEPGRTTTILRVQNVSATATLARVTLWTDLSYPTLAFDIYLTGYDVQAVNLMDVFLQRIVPPTADRARDPGDQISPQGPLSLDSTFPGCDDPDDLGYGDDGPLWGLPPPVPTFSENAADDLRYAHQGLPSVHGTYMAPGMAAAMQHDDDLMRGFVTVDVVQQCSQLVPTDPGYFLPGGTGVAALHNVLTGEVLQVDPTNNFMQADTLVPIEASASHPLTSSPTPGLVKPTFYGALLPTPGSAADHREPLPSRWLVPYRGQPDSPPALEVWREPDGPVTPFNPNTIDPVAPILLTEALPFNSEEVPATPFADDALPWPSGRYTLNDPGTPLPHRQGWILLDLSNPDGRPRQAWVRVISSSSGIFSAAHQGIQLPESVSGPKADRSRLGE